MRAIAAGVIAVRHLTRLTLANQFTCIVQTEAGIVIAMPTPRSDQIDLSTTPYYHCMARCVRRAYLCGKDAYSGRDFEHRRAWVRQRIHFLTEVFAIDVCAYAVLSNHLHVVLHVDQERANQWSNAEVVRRYCKLHPSARADYEALSASKQQVRRQQWRSRLINVSWMMRALNECIARRANKEDKVSGRFWEGRFKSQALLDEQGLLTCMAYVDLNPVRAGIAATLEASEYTSIRERLMDRERKRKHRRKRSAPKALIPFADQPSDGCAAAQLPVTFEAYVELLEWTGRLVAPGKRGKIVGPPPRILAESTLSPERWVIALAEQKVGEVAFLGKPESVEALAQSRGKAWLNGVSLARYCAG